MADVAVIIAAAGASTRFAGKLKKVFEKLDGREIFLRSCELFCNRDDVCQTILAVAPEDAEFVKDRYGANLGFMGVKLVTGGQTRAETVQASLKVVGDDAEYVAVHDAARPLVQPEHIDNVFAEARKSAAAVLATPVNGTIKRVSGAGVIDATVPRDGLYEAQTPQVFRKDLYVSAWSVLTAGQVDPAKITDDASVLELAKATVTIVEGPATNLKITRPEDMVLAEAILRALPKKKPTATYGAFEEAQW